MLHILTERWSSDRNGWPNLVLTVNDVTHTRDIENRALPALPLSRAIRSRSKKASIIGPRFSFEGDAPPGGPKGAFLVK